MLYVHINTHTRIQNTRINTHIRDKHIKHTQQTYAAAGARAVTRPEHEQRIKRFFFERRCLFIQYGDRVCWQKLLPFKGHVSINII